MDGYAIVPVSGVGLYRIGPKRVSYRTCRYVTCRQVFLILSDLKNNRYGGSSCLPVMLHLTKKKKKESTKITQKYITHTLVGRIGPYRLVSDTDRRFIANFFCHIISSRIHVSTYRIRCIGRLKWCFVQLYLKWGGGQMSTLIIFISVTNAFPRVTLRCINYTI